jgi:hypothetical protein
MNTITLQVSPENIAGLRSLVSKCTFPGVTLQVSAEKQGTGRVYEVVEGARGHYEQVQVGTYPVTLHDVVVTIPATVTESGWTVLARREFVGGTEAVTWYDGAQVFDTSALDAGACDACGLSRPRTYTLLIRKDTQTLQVGGSCVAKYVPARFEKALLSLSALLSQVRRLGEPDLFDIPAGQGLGRHEPVSRLVAIAILLHERSVPYVASKNSYGEPNHNATWRQVVRALELGSGADGNILDCIHTAEDVPAEKVRAVVDALVADLPELAYTYVLRSASGIIIPKVSRLLNAWAKADAPQVEQVLPPTGRVVVEGKILSIKRVESDWGVVSKALVDCGGYRLYGTLPGNLCSDVFDRNEVVRFKATVEPKEVGFGFYSRPGKAE